MDEKNHNETYISDVINDQQQLVVENNYSLSIEGIAATEPNIDIKVGDSFATWEDAEIKLNQYAKNSGFSLRRKRVELDKDGYVRR
jgi:hypothetical protein